MDSIREKFLALEESLFRAWNDYLALKEEYKRVVEAPEAIPKKEPEIDLRPKITEEQLTILDAELEDDIDILESIYKAYRVSNLSQLPAEDFKSIRLKIKKLKNIYHALK